MIYKINPVAKPRMTRSDKWKKRPATTKYWEFKDRVRELGITVENGDAIIFYVPMPPSWSKKKRVAHDGLGKESVPDVDNYLKALLDAVHDEDSHIWHLRDLKKIWSITGGIEIDRRV